MGLQKKTLTGVNLSLHFLMQINHITLKKCQHQNLMRVRQNVVVTATPIQCAFNLENPVVHERHKKTRTDSNACNDYQRHPIGELKNLCNQLIYFVTFVFFVGNKEVLRFKVYKSQRRVSSWYSNTSVARIT